MSKSKIFVYLALSFGVGVLVASKFSIPDLWIYLGLGLSSIVFIFSFLSSYKAALLAGLFLFAAGLGMLRLNAAMVANEYQDLLNNKQQLEGYVVEDPDIRSTGQFITFRPKNAKQNILLNTTLGQNFFYGDWLVVDGKLEEAKNFGDFDYQKYLQRFNVYAVMRYPKILILKSHQLNPAKEFLLKIKANFTKTLAAVLKEPQNSLGVGILIGGHGTLPKNIVDNFSATGTSHIIAVSGFNITIIVGALVALSYLLGRRATFWLASLCVLGFVILSGATASVVRAGIMGFLLLVSLNIGRQYSIIPSLFLAGLIMLVVNPKILFWDVGFQLSFAATMGIIYFLPLLENFTQKWSEMFGIKTLILTTLSAIIATLPIILFTFGSLSLVAPIANVLILPAVPLTMLFVFLSVFPFIGPGFALAASFLLSYIIKVIGFLAALPYSNLNIQISVWVFYALVAAVFGLYIALKFWLEKRVKVEQITPL